MIEISGGLQASLTLGSQLFGFWACKFWVRHGPLSGPGGSLQGSGVNDKAGSVSNTKDSRRNS